MNMDSDKVVVGFIGAGGIARSHAYSLNSLKYFYNSVPDIELATVCSLSRESRESFANRFGFDKSVDLEEFVADKRINTIYILGPNKVHYEHLKAVIGMSAIKRIYLEKPVCSNVDEEISVARLVKEHPDIKIQVGFQYLFSSAVREALLFWKSCILGKPIHFDLKYYHGDYLQKEYRDKRVSRLTPSPDGGAMADLGSHAISLMLAFMGNNLKITGASQAGNFEDVRVDSDLFSIISVFDKTSGAVGSLSASRISSGTGDTLSFEFYGEKGALRYSTTNPDYYEYFLEATGVWNKQMTGSSYKPVASFPSAHVPSGWLRSMIHAHYVFLTDSHDEQDIPDIEHGLAVQRLVTQTAEHLKAFRAKII
jgi:predicted dehydrogenase